MEMKYFIHPNGFNPNPESGDILILSTLFRAGVGN
jgi:hypothetical protein